MPSPDKGEGVRVGERELKCEVDYFLEVSGEPKSPPPPFTTSPLSPPSEGGDRGEVKGGRKGGFYGRVYQRLPYTVIARDTFTSLSVNSVPKQSQTCPERSEGTEFLPFASLRAKGSLTRNDNKKLLYETGDPFEFISFIEWSMIDTALERMEGYYQIHGGAVVKGDRGLILPAAPGSGKTTLTVGLTMNGFQCFSDDIVLIDMQSLKLNPFPRNIFITEEKKAVFDRYGINLSLRKSEWMEYGGWDFIPPHPPPLPQGERGFNVDFIIFPKYNPAQKTELKRISKGKAIFEIIKESFNIHKFRDRGVDIVHRLVENAECFQLTVNDLNEAIEIISDLFPPQRHKKLATEARRHREKQ